MKRIFKIVLVTIFMMFLSSCSKNTTERIANDISDEITILNMEYKIVDYDKYAKDGTEEEVDSKTCDKPYLIVEYDLSGTDKGDDDFVSYTLTFNLNNNGILNIEEADTSKITKDSSNNVSLYFSYGVSKISKKERIEGRIYLFETININLLIDSIKIETISLEYQDTYDLEIINENNDLRLVKYNGSEKDVIIPENINGYNITEIKQGAFSSCDNIESLTLPFIGGSKDSNQYLGYIFGASKYLYNNSYVPSSLKEVIISDGCTSIGEHAFSECSSLISITIPDSVKTIGEHAFYSCTSLTSITIPNGVTTIENYVFWSCSSLTSVSIPNSVTSIGNSVFYGCSKLSSITIPNSVTSMKKFAFYGCTSLKSITLPFIGGSKDSNQYLGYIFGASNCNKNNSCVPSSLKEVIISSLCMNVPDYAFYNCSNLESITIPNSITTIGEHAFSSCSSLTSIKIPDNVTSIEQYAFYGCSSLTSIAIPSSITSIGKSAFNNCSSLESIILPFIGSTKDSNQYLGYIFGSSSYYDNSSYVPSSLKEVSIYKGCTLIPSYAFYKCSTIESIILFSGATKIGNASFYGCSSLTSITIPSTVTSIEESAFSSCSSLTFVTIPNSVTTIGTSAFSSCSSLTSITIPDSVTSIGSQAFFNCSSLESITLPFVGKTSTTKQYLGYIFGASSYTYNESYIPSSLKKVTISKGCTLIPNYAFYKCSTIESITVPSSVTEIGVCAFYGCSSLTSITIPSTVTSIGNGAFSGCSSLESITIPSSVTSIGDSAFQSCSSLISVTIPSNVTTIESYTFNGCSSLESITIPSSVESIGSSAFCYCSKLKTINFNGTKEKWNSIDKDYDWNGLTGNYIIYCTDGNISK